MTVIIPFGVIMGLAWQGLRDQSPKHAAAIILANFQLKRLLKMLNFNFLKHSLLGHLKNYRTVFYAYMFIHFYMNIH